MGTFDKPVVLLTLACLGTTLGSCAHAGAAAPPLPKPAAAPWRRLDTVAVAADTAWVTARGSLMTRVHRGRLFAVLGREPGKVHVQVAIGAKLRRGTLAARHVRRLGEADVDLTAEALRIAKALNPHTHVAACRARLDALAGRLAAAAAKADSARSRARLIGAALFGPEGFAYEHGTKRLDLVLERRRGDCVGLSLIYLHVARRLDLPLRLVTWPSHVLVRHDDGHDRFDIETTAKGEVRNVDDPLRHRRGRAAGGIHHTPLPAPRAIGVLRHVWGTTLSAQGKWAKACDTFAGAVEINPRDVEALALWGAALDQLGRHAAACRRYAEVAAIDPGHEEVHIRWARALTQMEKRAEAAQHYARAAVLRPHSALIYREWAAVLARLGRRAEASDKLHRAAALAPWHRSQTDALRRDILHKE